MNYSYNYSSTADTAAAGGVMAVVWIISLIVAIVSLVAMWKLFTKAGEAGWKILIPFYNTYILFKIVYGNGWKFLMLLIPIFNYVVLIAYIIRLAQVYGKGVGFGILTLFFPEITLPILAFGNAQYEGPKSDAFI